MYHAPDRLLFLEVIAAQCGADVDDRLQGLLRALAGFGLSEKMAGLPGKEPMDEQIRQILAGHSRIPVDVATLSDDEDLFALGMTTPANVPFPKSMLRRSTFASVRAIRDGVAELTAVRAAT